MAKSIFVISPWTGRIGPNTFLEGFIRENIISGNSLTILYPTRDEISDEFQKLGCRVIFIQLLTLRAISNVYLKLVYRLLVECLLFFIFPYFLVKKRYNSCLVNTELFSFSLIIPSLLVRIILVVHSLSFYGNKLTKIIFGLQQQAVHQYIAVSEAVKMALINMGIKKEIRRVYNGLDLSESSDPAETRPRSGKVQIISIIHSLPHKGAHYLLEVLDKVVAVEKGFHCSIIGWGSPLHDTPYKKEIEARSGKLGLQEFLTFRGITNNIKAEYRKADIMIHPSESESFGYVIVEAMVEGMPVIAFKVGGIPEIIENRSSGILIEPFDIDSMASELLTLIRSAHIRSQYGIRGKQIVDEKFNLKKNMSEIVGML